MQLCFILGNFFAVRVHWPDYTAAWPCSTSLPPRIRTPSRVSSTYLLSVTSPWNTCSFYLTSCWLHPSLVSVAIRYYIETPQYHVHILLVVNVTIFSSCRWHNQFKFCSAGSVSIAQPWGPKLLPHRPVLPGQRSANPGVVDSGHHPCLASRRRKLTWAYKADMLLSTGLFCQSFINLIHVSQGACLQAVTTLTIGVILDRMHQSSLHLRSSQCQNPK